MAKKSKTQRAKASARRAEKKALAEAAESIEEVAEVEEEEKKGKFFSRKEKPVEESKPVKSSSKKPAKIEKKNDGIFNRAGYFIKAVRSERRRVTWPTRQDVIRWSGVVVLALVFFSVFVFVLDNWIVTPLLLAISTLGA